MNDYPVKSPRKLIEVAIPLDAISVGCHQDKNPFLKNHPRGIHLWWARRPLAAARAIAFAQMVNDPGFQRGGGFQFGKKKEIAEIERKKLFDLMEKLVLWENTDNPEVIREAREKILESWKETCLLNKEHPDAELLFNEEKLPFLHDPFAGGGAIPLEAQRLGLPVIASDLNPVAVLINKALIEFPQAFADRDAVSGGQSKLLDTQKRPTDGLATDIRFYGQQLKEFAKQKLSKFYPRAKITEERVRLNPSLKSLVGETFPVFAWLWARTVHSPDPAFSNVEVPLVSTYVLSSKKEVYLKPCVKGKEFEFSIHSGDIPESAKLGTKAAPRGAAFRCILSDVPISPDYIRKEGKSGRIGYRLIGLVCKTKSGRLYLPALKDDQRLAESVEPDWQPNTKFFPKALGFRIANYGMTQWSDLFTKRQLLAISTLCSEIETIHKRVEQDALARGVSQKESLAYANAIAAYLSVGISQWTRYACVRCAWNNKNENVAQAFGRQVINMIWDFAESNPVEGALAIDATIEWVANGLKYVTPVQGSLAEQADARDISGEAKRVFSTDPPYYDNIGYADLSDFFYVWLRRALRPFFPNLFSTIETPKDDELVATPDRHGGKPAAQTFFLEGMKSAIKSMVKRTHPAFPLTIYYAFKQSETDSAKGTSSTGWDTFLTAVVESGLQITGTWPIRSEKTQGLKGNLNALASCVVLVCRNRNPNAEMISRRAFIRELDEVLPLSLDEMTRGAGENSRVAPVDLSQAIIGPGMAVFSKYKSVLEADGSMMSVKTALQLINRFLAEDDFDQDTQFCLHWFEQHGWSEGVFGEADVLARAKATSVDGLASSGVLESGLGKVKLREWSRYPVTWDSASDSRIPIWEVLHQLIRAHKQGGDNAAGAVLGQPEVIAKAEAARQLAYRLYTLCERKGWADDARNYNELITAWTNIESSAPQIEQGELF